MLPEALSHGSVLEALTEDPTNMATWLAAEQHVALQQLHVLAHSEGAWQVQGGSGGGGYGTHTSGVGGRCSGGVGGDWQP